jgi:hypothetical protein
VLLTRALFASYVCSSIAMRDYNHAGFVMSMAAPSEQRRPPDHSVCRDMALSWTWLEGCRGNLI